MADWKDKYPVPIDHLIYVKVERIARIKEISIEQWVNESLRKAVVEAPEAAEAMRQVIYEAGEVNAPTADIEQMLREIESGYLNNGYFEE